MKNKGMIFMGLGFELVGLIIGSLYMGHQIDKFYDLNGFGMVGLMLLALVGWFIHLIKLLKNYMAENTKENITND